MVQSAPDTSKFLLGQCYNLLSYPNRKQNVIVFTLKKIDVVYTDSLGLWFYIERDLFLPRNSGLCVSTKYSVFPFCRSRVPAFCW